MYSRFGYIRHLGNLAVVSISFQLRDFHTSPAGIIKTNYAIGWDGIILIAFAGYIL